MRTDAGGGRRPPPVWSCWIGGVVAIAVIAGVAGLGGTSTGRAGAGLLGLDASAPTLTLDVATGLAIALVTTGFAFLLRPLPFQLQTVGVWLALLALFLPAYPTSSRLRSSLSRAQAAVSTPRRARWRTHSSKKSS